MWFRIFHYVLLLTALLAATHLCGQESSAVVTLPPVQDSTLSADAPAGDLLFPLPPLDPIDPTVDATVADSPAPLKPRTTAFNSLGLGRNSNPGYGATWYPTSSSGGADVGLVRQYISGGYPVWKDGGDAVMLTGSVRNAHFDTNLILPETLQPFPEDLWNINLGTMFLRKFDNGASGMVTLNFGSASDQPFHSIEELTYGLIAMYQTPARNERDKWQFMVFYSPVGNFNFPMPGIAYQWNPSEMFQMSIGLPFSLNWRPTERWVIELSYLPVLSVNAKASFLWTETVTLYGGFESFQETYLLAGRANNDDRFVGFEQRVISGVRWAAWSKASLDCHAGYAFERYFGTGQNQIGGGLDDQVDLPSGAFVGANFILRF